MNNSRKEKDLAQEHMNVALSVREIFSVFKDLECRLAVLSDHELEEMLIRKYPLNKSFNKQLSFLLKLYNDLIKKS